MGRFETHFILYKLYDNKNVNAQEKRIEQESLIKTRVLWLNSLIMRDLKVVKADFNSS